MERQSHARQSRGCSHNLRPWNARLTLTTKQRFLRKRMSKLCMKKPMPLLTNTISSLAEFSLV